jgi:hypothetical protein
MAVENMLSKRDIESLYPASRLGLSQDLPYFFAGSLMFPGSIRALSSGVSLQGIISTMTVATLHGYKRHAVKGAPYPAFSPSDNLRDKVTGLACFGLNAAQRKRIHDFNGRMFDLRRATIEIELSDGDIMPLEAGLYVWNKSRHHLFSTDLVVWSPHEMLQADWFQNIVEETREEETALEITGALGHYPKGDSTAISDGTTV